LKQEYSDMTTDTPREINRQARRDLESARKDAEILRRDISGYARDRAALIAALAHATDRIACYGRWTSDRIVASAGTVTDKYIAEDARQILPALRAALATVQS
jgi:hypothetical protein